MRAAIDRSIPSTSIANSRQDSVPHFVFRKKIPRVDPRSRRHTQHESQSDDLQKCPRRQAESGIVQHAVHVYLASHPGNSSRAEIRFQRAPKFAGLTSPPSGAGRPRAPAGPGVAHRGGSEQAAGNGGRTRRPGRGTGSARSRRGTRDRSGFAHLTTDFFNLHGRLRDTRGSAGQARFFYTQAKTWMRVLRRARR